MTELTFRKLSYGDPVVKALEDQLQDEYMDRYGSYDGVPLAGPEFESPSGCFLVGFLGDVPVAMGGFRRQSPGIAEVKRMYVIPEHRGCGHARRVLTALEATAAEAGYQRIVLHTGTAQPEAISLYTARGYIAIDRFAPYPEDERSLFFGKDLSHA